MTKISATNVTEAADLIEKLASLKEIRDALQSSNNAVLLINAMKGDETCDVVLDEEVSLDHAMSKSIVENAIAATEKALEKLGVDLPTD
jgi:hypothetical protein